MHELFSSKNYFKYCLQKLFTFIIGLKFYLHEGMATICVKKTDNMVGEKRKYCNNSIYSAISKLVTLYKVYLGQAYVNGFNCQPTHPVH